MRNRLLHNATMIFLHGMYLSIYVLHDVNIREHYSNIFNRNPFPVFVRSCARCITVWWHFMSNAPMNFWPRKLSLDTQSIPKWDWPRRRPFDHPVGLKMGTPVKCFFLVIIFKSILLVPDFWKKSLLGQLQHGRCDQHQHPNCHQRTLATTITSITYI